jgi:hypothetical protein
MGSTGLSRGARAPRLVIVPLQVRPPAGIAALATGLDVPIAPPDGLSFRGCVINYIGQVSGLDHARCSSKGFVPGRGRLLTVGISLRLIGGPPGVAVERHQPAHYEENSTRITVGRTTPL